MPFDKEDRPPSQPPHQPKRDMPSLALGSDDARQDFGLEQPYLTGETVEHWRCLAAVGVVSP